jgi:hypothetical protein
MNEVTLRTWIATLLVAALMAISGGSHDGRYLPGTRGSGRSLYHW